jgi:EmrB/QacA subfamily drug resistance transporter
MVGLALPETIILERISDMPQEKQYAKSRLILYTVMIGAFMSMFDSGVVNVGLPVIAGQFRADINTVQWIASVYLLVMSALLPILGTVADHFGRRKIYNTGFFVISIFTLFCGFSVNLSMLIVMRILQAVGGAMVMANGMAIVTENYPPSERGRNLGLLMTMMAIGSIAGPPLGGIAIGLWGWRSVFYLTFLVSIAGFIVSYISIPRDRKPREMGYRFDLVGSLSLVISVVAFIYGFSNLAVTGIKNPLVLTSILVFAASFVIFIVIEKRKMHPVVHLDLFRNWVFSTSIIASLLSFVTMFAPVVLIPFYYQEVLGISPQTAGLYMMAFPVAMAVVSPFSGSLSDKIGSAFLTTAGLVVNGIALILLANINLQTPIVLILVYVGLMGLSLGLFQSPNNSSIMGSVPKNRLGAANGITQLIKNIGMVIGIAFSVSLFTAFLGTSPIHDGSAFLQSAKCVYYIAAGLSFIGAMVSAVRNREFKKRIVKSVAKNL